MIEGFEGADERFPEEIFSWLEGDASPATSAAVQAWVAEAPERREALRDFARVWQLARAPEAPAGWEALERRIGQTEAWAARKTSRAAPRTGWRVLLRAAAVLVIGLGLGLLWPRLQGTLAPAQHATVIVPAGSQTELTLPGGVRVRLNSASELAYVPSRNVRELRLEGEAYFTVPDGAKHNLLVHTTAGTVRDLGTAFNVRARGQRTAVAVTEGRVALETRRGAVTLDAGQESWVAAGGRPAPPALAQLDRATGWMSGRLVLYDEPLAEVAAELERRYGIRVEVAPALAGTRLTASVEAHAEGSDAVRLICEAVDARCEQTASGWAVRPRR